MPAVEAAVMMVHDATRRFIVYGGFQPDGSVSNHIQAFEGVNAPKGFPLIHCEAGMARSSYGIEVQTLREHAHCLLHCMLAPVHM